MFSHSDGILGDHFAALRAEPPTVVKEKSCRECDRRFVGAAMVPVQYAQAAAFEAAAAAAGAQWTN